MNGGFLLDTNIVIGILENDASIISRIDPGRPLYLPCIAMGELFYGAYNSSRVEPNVQKLITLAKSVPVLECGLRTAGIYGTLKAELRKKGRPIPDNDIWIAAISQERQLTLLSRDGHFQQFETLATLIL